MNQLSHLICLQYIKGKIINKEFVKFLLVGAINTLFGYSFYVFFLIIGLHYTFAVMFSTILGVFFNFKSFGIFVFNNRSNSLIIKFFSVYCVIYFVNIFCIKIFKILNYDLYFSGGLALLPVALLSYFLNKYFVFKKENLK
jgi:putative flippase GtrA